MAFILFNREHSNTRGFYTATYNTVNEHIFFCSEPDCSNQSYEEGALCVHCEAKLTPPVTHCEDCGAWSQVFPDNCCHTCHMKRVRSAPCVGLSAQHPCVGGQCDDCETAVKREALGLRGVPHCAGGCGREMSSTVRRAPEEGDAWCLQCHFHAEKCNGCGRATSVDPETALCVWCDQQQMLEEAEQNGCPDCGTHTADWMRCDQCHDEYLYNTYTVEMNSGDLRTEIANCETLLFWNDASPEGLERIKKNLARMRRALAARERPGCVDCGKDYSVGLSQDPTRCPSCVLKSHLPCLGRRNSVSSPVAVAEPSPSVRPRANQYVRGYYKGQDGVWPRSLLASEQLAGYALPMKNVFEYCDECDDVFQPYEGQEHIEKCYSCILWDIDHPVEAAKIGPDEMTGIGHALRI